MPGKKSSNCGKGANYLLILADRKMDTLLCCFTNSGSEYSTEYELFLLLLDLKSCCNPQLVTDHTIFLAFCACLCGNEAKVGKWIITDRDKPPL